MRRRTIGAIQHTLADSLAGSTEIAAGTAGFFGFTTSPSTARRLAATHDDQVYAATQALLRWAIPVEMDAILVYDNRREISRY